MSNGGAILVIFLHATIVADIDEAKDTKNRFLCKHVKKIKKIAKMQ